MQSPVTTTRRRPARAARAARAAWAARATWRHSDHSSACRDPATQRHACPESQRLGIRDAAAVQVCSGAELAAKRDRLADEIGRRVSQRRVNCLPWRTPRPLEQPCKTTLQTALLPPARRCLRPRRQRTMPTTPPMARAGKLRRCPRLTGRLPTIAPRVLPARARALARSPARRQSAPGWPTGRRPGRRKALPGRKVMGVAATVPIRAPLARPAPSADRP